MTPRTCVLIAGAAVAALCAPLIGEWPKAVVWNASESVPIGLYRIADVDALEVPGLVAVRPPEQLESFLDSNGYLPRGALLLKRLAGLPGQTVCRAGAAVTVDGIAFGDALASDRFGRQLPVWRGCRRIAQHDIFLMNFEVSDSLDGRYFGPLPRSAIVGRAIPILTRDSASEPFVWRAPTH